MKEGIQETVNVVASAGEAVVSQGVLGALLILSLSANCVLGWLLYRSRSEFNRFLQIMALGKGSIDGK